MYGYTGIRRNTPTIQSNIVPLRRFAAHLHVDKMVLYSEIECTARSLMCGMIAGPPEQKRVVARILLNAIHWFNPIATMPSHDRMPLMSSGGYQLAQGQRDDSSQPQFSFHARY